MYRKRVDGSKKYNAMRLAKLRRIEERVPPEYPPCLPELRRRIIIEDFDFGEVRHTVNLYRTNRIDCFRMEVDELMIAERIGWSRVLEKIRKAFLRIQAI